MQVQQAYNSSTNVVEFYLLTSSRFPLQKPNKRGEKLKLTTPHYCIGAICEVTMYSVPILVGVGKDRRIKTWFMVKPEKAVPISRTNLRTKGYWRCAGGLSAVNTIGTHLL